MGIVGIEPTSQGLEPSALTIILYPRLIRSFKDLIAMPRIELGTLAHEASVITFSPHSYICPAGIEPTLTGLQPVVQTITLWAVDESARI